MENRNLEREMMNPAGALERESLELTHDDRK
jgi:hypothetical protein